MLHAGPLLFHVPAEAMAQLRREAREGDAGLQVRSAGRRL